MKIISDLSLSESIIFSGYFIFSFNSTNNIETKKKNYNIEISLSSVYDEISVDPEILYQIATTPDFDVIKILNFINVHNIFEPNYSITTII
jgi:hypothetical protein